ncbi:MFS transporter [Conexibacter sp. JD483]|uniref:MFS transporter n=1 Tax=unclassified Conexibacter TaxID=2627773 RepID=UPI002723B2E2|nr:MULTISPECIES: MFS transporter [unclassified Conexibacter]MDO8186111.1 MFS transporter [Conexibacter sp. CPCC 205706]MDO8199601.1 MFS transporter [Conexibacter sp. CPCC 205762]MDR9369145.1 MFS transporter [Conexibacter sp. JD483]
MTTEAALTAAEAPPDADAGHPKRWWILVVVLLVECMDLLDGTIVNVAAPSISSELHASSTALQWIVGGYALALAVGLVLGGRLGDLYGRRHLFIAGTIGFTVCSLLCGIAPSTGVLIAFRLLQGLAAAMMIPQGFGIIRSAFSTAELPKAFGLFGPVIGLSAVLGPIVGGVLVDADLFGTGWRLIFLVNLPLGIAAVAGAIALLPESRTPGVSRLDGVGAVLVAAAVGLLIYPLIQGRELDWPAWTFVMMAAGGVLFAVFGWHERARERAGRDPLVTTSIFSKRAYVSGAFVLLLFFAGMMGLMLVLTLYLQLGLGFSAIHAGLTLVPQSLGMAVGAGLGGALLAPRFGRHTLHLGLLVMAIGMVALLLVVNHNGLDVTTFQLAGPQLVAGLGIGLVVAPLFSLVLAAVGDEEVGSASGVLNATQQLGAAVGIAVIGTVFFTVLGDRGFTAAFERVVWWVLALTAAAAVLALFLPMEPREEEVH